MAPPTLRCAIYTRKSSEEGLEQSFNSLEAQREACENYIKSQAHEGWTLVPDRFDDGGDQSFDVSVPAMVTLTPATKELQASPPTRRSVRH